MKGFFYRVLTVARHPKPAAQRSFRNAHARWTVFTSKPWEGRAKIVGFIGLKVCITVSPVSTLLTYPLACQLFVCSTPLFRVCGVCLSGKLMHNLTKLLLTKLKMDGPSMEPTFADHGECVIENRLSYKLRPDSIARGDIVTLRSPLDPFRIVCKRVIGLAGDVICVDPTGVLAPSTEHVIIPKGHVWLSGDNATMSRDSRQYGPVSTALIRGKLCARASTLTSSLCFSAEPVLQVWPLTKFKIFSNPTTFLD